MGYDLVILGGGPAGSAAAYAAVVAGLSTLIIDKARFPREKLCGGLITERSRTVYREVFGQEFPDGLCEGRTAISFFLDGQSLGRLDDVPAMYLTMRWDFDAHLLTLVKGAGAAVMTGTRVQSIDLAGDRLRLADGQEIGYRVLLGADGVNSMVARALFGRAFDPDTIGFALEKEMPPETDPTVAKTVRVDFGAAAWGYGWSFPKSRSVTVGVGGLQSENPDLKSSLHRYADALNQGSAEGMKGHFLPFGDYRRRPGRGNVILAGDAAAFVDPITGEGIAHALDSGRLAAAAAARALREGRACDTAMIYRAATRKIRSSLAIAKILRPIIFAPWMAPVFSHAFSKSMTVRRAYMQLLAGDLEYWHILSMVTRRLPGAALRALRASR